MSKWDRPRYTFRVDANYFAQLRHAGAVAEEYDRRLRAEGFDIGEGAMQDCVTVHSQEQSDRVEEIFDEVCKELRS